MVLLMMECWLLDIDDASKHDEKELGILVRLTYDFSGPKNGTGMCTPRGPGCLRSNCP